MPRGAASQLTTLSLSLAVPYCCLIEQTQIRPPFGHKLSLACVDRIHERPSNYPGYRKGLIGLHPLLSTARDANRHACFVSLSLSLFGPKVTAFCSIAIHYFPVDEPTRLRHVQ